jgi:hypothetical protein
VQLGRDFDRGAFVECFDFAKRLQFGADLEDFPPSGWRRALGVRGHNGKYHAAVTAANGRELAALGKRGPRPRGHINAELCAGLLT